MACSSPGAAVSTLAARTAYRQPARKKSWPGTRVPLPYLPFQPPSKLGTRPRRCSYPSHRRPGARGPGRRHPGRRDEDSRGPGKTCRASVVHRRQGREAGRHRRCRHRPPNEGAPPSIGSRLRASQDRPQASAAPTKGDDDHRLDPTRPAVAAVDPSRERLDPAQRSLDPGHRPAGPLEKRRGRSMEVEGWEWERER